MRSLRSIAAVLWVLVAPGTIGMSHGQIRFTKVEVVVETSPKALVFLDGRQVGQAAASGGLTIQVTPGEHSLEVRLSGKRPFQQKFAAAATGKPLHIRAELIDYTGDLEVFTTEDAEVLVDGKPAGVADSTGRLLIRGLRTGYHTVRVGRAGYNPEERGLYVEADVSGTVTIALKRIEAPVGADIEKPPNYVLHRRLLSDHSGFVETIFRADSLQFMSCSDSGEGCNLVIFWDPSTGRQVRSIEVDPALNLRAASPDLKWLAGTARKQGPGIIHLIDADTGRSVRRLPVSLEANSAAIASVRFSADGTHLVSLDTNGWVLVWELQSGKNIRRFQIAGPDFRHLTLSPDGRWMAAGGYQGVALWDMHTWNQTQSFPEKDVVLVRFSPDSRWIALASNAVSLFDVPTGKPGRKILELANQGLEFLPGSRFIAAMYGRSLQLWDCVSGLKAAEFAVDGGDFDFSPDGRWLAIGSGWPTKVELWRRTE